jgi:dienelactone hydrolase
MLGEGWTYPIYGHTKESLDHYTTTVALLFENFIRMGNVLVSREEKMKTITRTLNFILLAAVVGFVAISSSSRAQTGPADGTLLGVRPYTFPEYSDAYGYTRFDGSQDAIQKYWTKEVYERSISDDQFEFLKLLYASDGLSVVAYVYKPRKVDTALPTIIFNRGSYAHQDLAPVLVPYFHRLAKEGFVVIAPMYRQTDGGEGKDANGGDDLNDLLNLLPLVQSLPYADARNIFMTGESRGAMMVFQAIREAFPMRAAAVWGGFTDMRPLMEAQPALVAYAAKNWPGFDADEPEADIRRRSAIFWPEEFHVPILLMHGESDRSIPVEHTLNLARELQKHNRLYGLIIFADDNHVLSRSQLERDRASLQWFRRFDVRAEAELMQALRTTASEREVTQRGYSLLARGRIEDAVKVFRILVKRFPESSNANDSLGEALISSGDKKSATESYQRALELATEQSDKDRIQEVLLSLR